MPMSCLFLSLRLYWWKSKGLTVIFPPSITYMTIHDPSFVEGQEHWDNGSLDLEKRYRLGSEVTSLSRSSSSEKNDPLDNLNLSFRLISSMKWESCDPLFCQHKWLTVIFYILMSEYEAMSTCDPSSMSYEQFKEWFRLLSLSFEYLLETGRGKTIQYLRQKAHRTTEK